jgi:hypothetical protein
LLLRQFLKQLDRSWQRRDVRREFAEEFGVPVAEALQGCLVDRAPELALELRREQAAAHSDLSVDPPNGKIQPVFVECDVPGSDMVVDAVDQSPVEIEQECDWRCHRVTNSTASHPFPRSAAGSKGRLAPILDFLVFSRLRPAILEKSEVLRATGSG